MYRRASHPTPGRAANEGPHFETSRCRPARRTSACASNGQIVLQSQGYSSKSSAEGGIASVKKNGVNATSFEVVEGPSGQATFRVVATNGKIIGRGEMYASKSNALAGANTVHDILRDLAGSGEATDAQIEAEINAASEG